MHFIRKSIIAAIDILQVLYANSHPFLIASQTSLEDLNTRLSEAIPMDSFRPNIIVSGDDNSKPQPYEEVSTFR
jgi:uncharacterized protein YcbX